MKSTFLVIVAVLIVAHPATAAKPPDALAVEARFLPDNCQMVGIVHVKQLLDSEAYKQLKKESAVVRNREKAIADNMPLPLEMIESLFFGGSATGDEEGLWVVRTRDKITADQVVWFRNRLDRPLKKPVLKYDLYQRRGDSYCIVGEKMLVFGKGSVLQAVLERERPPELADELDKALAAADLTATIAFALDVPAVRTKRSGEPVPFIPGLRQMRLAESSMEALALTAKFDDKQIELNATALAMINAPAKFLKVEDSAKFLSEEANRFKQFHLTALKQDRKAPDSVLDIFKLNIAVDGKKVTASTTFGASAFARLLMLLSQ